MKIIISQTRFQPIILPPLRVSVNKSKVSILSHSICENDSFHPIKSLNLNIENDSNLDVTINLETEMEAQVTSRAVRIFRLEKLVKMSSAEVWKLVQKAERISERTTQLDTYVDKLFRGMRKLGRRSVQ